MSSGTEVDGRRQAKPGTRRQRRTRAAGRTPTAQPRRTASLAASRPKGGAPRHQEDRQPRGRPPSGCHGGPPAAGPHPRCGGPERGAERRGTGKWPGSVGGWSRTSPLWFTLGTLLGEGYGKGSGRARCEARACVPRACARRAVKKWRCARARWEWEVLILVYCSPLVDDLDERWQGETCAFVPRCGERL